jgi:serine/threonine protein kinase
VVKRQQAAGQAVDFRSDQFSFGSILYEMLTGKVAFRRETAAQTLAAIIGVDQTELQKTIAIVFHIMNIIMCYFS